MFRVSEDSFEKMRAFAASTLCCIAVFAVEINHVHLALSSDTSKMFVQWTTDAAAVAENTVMYGSSPSGLSQSAYGTAWSFTDSTGRIYFFHKATMTDLTPGTTVFYAVGGPSNFSSTRSFVATRTNISSADPLRIAWIGDLGFANSQAMTYLLPEIENNHFDHIVGPSADLFPTSSASCTMHHSHQNPPPTRLQCTPSRHVPPH